jgi:DNA invertase Pin-like site-specific DNA recombinase
MAQGEFVAYYRVSTERQGKSGLGLEAQKEAVLSYLNGGHWKMIDEFVEVESGTRKGNHRPALALALALCRIHNATLIIAKLDRLSRNVNFISNLMEAGVEFTAVDFPQANRLTIHILAAVAEHEAVMISQRTKAALAAAKARGVVLGGDRGNIASESTKGNKASAAYRQAKARKRANDLKPVIHAIQSEGAESLRQIAAVLNARGIPAARGGMWQARQVQIILQQIAE